MDPILLSAVLLSLAGLILLMLGLLGLVGTLPRAAFIVLGVVALLIGMAILINIYIIPAAAGLSTIGIVLIVLGILFLLYAVAKSGEGRAVIGLIGVLLIVSGVLLGGGFASLQPAPAPTPGAVWDVRVTQASFTPATVVATQTTGSQSVDIYGTRTELAKLTGVTVNIQITNLNVGQSTQAWQFTATTSRIDIVTDPSTGTSAPIASKATFTGTGVMNGDTYYDVVQTGGIKSIVAHIPVNGAAFSNASIGNTYSVLLLVATKNITVNFHPTG